MKKTVEKVGLIHNLKIDVDQEHINRFRLIEEEDFSGMKRKAGEMLLAQGNKVNDEYLDRGIEALKLYYALPVLDPLNGHAISAELDPFWHAHMLFSRQYMEFSKKVIGTYMHHLPLDRYDSRQMKNIRALYAHTIEILNKSFKYVDSYFWSRKVIDIRMICSHSNDCPANPYDPKVVALALFKPTKRGEIYAF